MGTTSYPRFPTIFRDQIVFTEKGHASLASRAGEEWPSRFVLQ